jgi:hypothetical protein
VSITKLSNEVQLSVVTPAGEKLDTRTLHNVALPELFPNEPVVIIDWVANGQAPTEEELKVPVLAEGQTFYGWYGWGSAVKRGQTLGLTHDLLAQDAVLLKTAERAQKTSRMLLGQGLYGGLKGTFNVMVVKRGTIVNGHPVDDGHGLIRRELAERGDSGLEKITLGKARQSYTFWQRIPWSDDLEAELKPIIDDTLVDAANPANWLYRKGAQWDERKALADLDESMIEHPYIAQALSRSSAEDFARVATTVDVPATVRVAVPTTAGRAVVDGRCVLVRYPVDSNGSLQAVDEDPDQDDVERIAKMEVIQHTVASKDLMANGCFGVVDELPEGVDLVLCVDDIKMGDRDVGIRMVEGVVTFNQWYAPGCAVGVNSKWAKVRMGLDYDGDLVFVYDCSELPVLWQAVSDLTPGKTPKLEKTKSRLDARPKMIVNSMKNLVGFASNVASTTFAVADRDKLARDLGYKSESSLNAALNWFIKVGTDGFKTMVDLGKVEQQLNILQSNLQRVLGKSVPWTKWPNEWAFRRGVPAFYKEGMDENEAKNAVPAFFDGTIAQICRLTLPSMKAALEVRGLITVKPLSSFRDWAPRVSKDVAGQAHELQMEFNARVRRVNFTDGEDILAFRRWWQDKLAAWTELPRETVCAAMWREAHNSRSEDASAASVFIGFPALVKWIISDKPGLDEDGTDTLLVGLNYVFDEPVTRITVPVQVREFEQEKGRKRVVRKIVCGDVPGKKAPRAPYPEDLIGMVELRAQQPEVGEYVAHIVKAGHGKAWLL